MSIEEPAGTDALGWMPTGGTLLAGVSFQELVDYTAGFASGRSEPAGTAHLLLGLAQTEEVGRALQALGLHPSRSDALIEQLGLMQLLPERRESGEATFTPVAEAAIAQAQGQSDPIAALLDVLLALRATTDLGALLTHCGLTADSVQRHVLGDADPLLACAGYRPAPGALLDAALATIYQRLTSAPRPSLDVASGLSSRDALVISSRAASLEQGGRFSGRLALSNINTIRQAQDRSPETLITLELLHAGDRHIELASPNPVAALYEEDPQVSSGVAAIRLGLFRAHAQHLLHIQVFAHLKLADVLPRIRRPAPALAHLSAGVEVARLIGAYTEEGLAWNIRGDLLVENRECYDPTGAAEAFARGADAWRQAGRRAAASMSDTKRQLAERLETATPAEQEELSEQIMELARAALGKS